MDESLPERPALFFDFVLPPRSKELFANLWIADPHDTTPMIRPHVNGSRLGRLSELLMMHIVRIVKGRQNFCVTSRLFNMFVKKRSQLTHECNNFFIVPARECERTQFPYPIFKGGGHGPYRLGAGCHKALKRFSTGNNVGQRGSFPEHEYKMSTKVIEGERPKAQTVWKPPQLDLIDVNPSWRSVLSLRRGLVRVSCIDRISPKKCLCLDDRPFSDECEQVVKTGLFLPDRAL